MRAGRHQSKFLQNVADKYGVETLRFEMLLVCVAKDCQWYEQRAIDRLRPRYNVHPFAWGGALKGHPTSEATRVKLRSQAGWKHTEEAKAKMRGRVRTAEHTAKLAAAKRGRRGNNKAGCSAETREKIRATHKARIAQGLGQPFWTHRKVSL